MYIVYNVFCRSLLPGGLGRRVVNVKGAVIYFRKANS